MTHNVLKIDNEVGVLKFILTISGLGFNLTFNFLILFIFSTFRLDLGPTNCVHDNFHLISKGRNLTGCEIALTFLSHIFQLYKTFPSNGGSTFKED